MQGVSAVPKLREGKDQVQQTELKSAGEKPKQYMQHLEEQLNPSYQGHNAQIEHHTHITVIQKSSSLNPELIAWIWLSPQFKEKSQD